MYIERVQRSGTHSRVAMVHLRRSISQAKGLDELLPLVVQLSQNTEDMMNGRTLSECDIHRIAVPLAKIRLLLTTLIPPGCGADAVYTENALVRNLVDRYRDIEGRIKEKRNDLARKKASRLP